MIRNITTITILVEIKIVHCLRTSPDRLEKSLTEGASDKVCTKCPHLCRHDVQNICQP